MSSENKKINWKNGWTEFKTEWDKHSFWEQAFVICFLVLCLIMVYFAFYGLVLLLVNLAPVVALIWNWWMLNPLFNIPLTLGVSALAIMLIFGIFAMITDEL